MEASALHVPAGLSRLPLSSSLLRLRSDEQLVALFRAGSDEAFRVLHDRYRQRLFAYVRQMLSQHARADAEDVLQDVFVRAFAALRGDAREVNVRAWLYRVAHNRCIDHLRRPRPAASEIFDVSRKPLLDPVDEAQRRDDLKRLVHDVSRLPEQQRSALLMREIDGLSYADLAAALDVTVPAVKSLLVRARVGLVEAQESRDADCQEIRRDLLAAYDRGVKASGRARRHMRECSGCREYRGALRGVRRSFAALTPAGPLALVAKLVGLGGAGGGAAAAGTGGGGVAVAVGGATACKVAAVVCATAITAGGAVEVRKLTTDPGKSKREQSRTARDDQAAAAGGAAASGAAVGNAPAGISSFTPPRSATPAVHAPTHTATAPATTAPGRDESITAPPPQAVGHADEPQLIESEQQRVTGGAQAPAEEVPPHTGSVTEPPVKAQPGADGDTPIAGPDAGPVAGDPVVPPASAGAEPATLTAP